MKHCDDELDSASHVTAKASVGAKRRERKNKHKDKGAASQAPDCASKGSLNAPSVATDSLDRGAGVGS